MSCGPSDIYIYIPKSHWAENDFFFGPGSSHLKLRQCRSRGRAQNAPVDMRIDHKLYERGEIVQPRTTNVHGCYFEWSLYSRCCSRTCVLREVNCHPITLAALLIVSSREYDESTTSIIFFIRRHRDFPELGFDLITIRLLRISPGSTDEVAEDMVPRVAVRSSACLHFPPCRTNEMERDGISAVG